MKYNDIHPNHIITRIAHLYETTLEAVRSGSRKRPAAHARQACCWVLAKRYPDWTLNQIAKLVGIRDHTTVMFALEQVERRRSEDRELTLELDAAVRWAPSPQPGYGVPQSLTYWRTLCPIAA